MFCTNCGKELKTEAKFCPRCGESVVAVDELIPQKVQNVATTRLNMELKKKKPVVLWIGIIGVVLIAAVIITTIVLTSGAKKSEYDEKMDLGRKYLLELDYEQAALAFEEAIKIDPKKKEAYIELAELYVKQRKNEKAIEILENAKEAIEDEREKDLIEKKKKEIEKKTEIIREDNNAETAIITQEPTESQSQNQSSVSDSTVNPAITQSPEPIINGDVGDVILFGLYEQDNNLSNGREPIEWIVLSNDGEKMLLLSKYALDCMPYNEDNVSITWESCTLRNWLNEEFYNVAFNNEEKSKIISSLLNNADNPVYGTNGGDGTEDFVFLLSLEDMVNTEYGFSADSKTHDVIRRCAPTSYAISKETYKYDGDDGDYLTDEGLQACWWWLRSPGEMENQAAMVFLNGEILNYGDMVDYFNYAVRPAIYINLNPELPSAYNQDPVSETDRIIDEAFQAYYKIIKKKKDTLDVPFANWDKSMPEVPRQTVAILNVWGDEIPELILAEAEHVEDIYNIIEPLSIYTYENGKTKKIFERKVDLEGVDFIYYNLMLTNTNELYLYEVSGCDRGYGTWSHLLSNGKQTEKIEMIKIDGYEADIPYDTFYDSNNKEITSVEFYDWKSKFDTSVTCSVFSNTSHDYGDSIGMNYREAVEFFENWKENGLTDGIEWFEEKYYPLSINKLLDEVKSYEDNLIFGGRFDYKDYPNQAYDTGLDKDLMTRIAVFSSAECREEFIKYDTHYYNTEYPEGYYYINSEELEKEGIKLFGESLNTSYLTSQRYNEIDVYNDSIYGPVYSFVTWENYDEIYENSVSVRKSGKKYIVTKTISGYFGINYDYAYAEIIYTLEKNSKSEYGCVITELKIKLLDR